MRTSIRVVLEYCKKSFAFQRKNVWDWILKKVDFVVDSVRGCHVFCGFRHVEYHAF